ncbi:MAG: hypothetical protein PVH40_10235 [Gemmatimonadales bacterium]
MSRLRTLWLVGTLVVFTIASQVGAASQSRLLNRWVGTHDGRPWWLDFYGDTMLVVDDTLILNFRITRDSLIAYGDTSFSVAYWFVRDRLLIQTVGGEVITMAPQDHMARPIHGEWRGNGIRLRIWRGGVATWAGRRGEWRRRSRIITFTWLPDSVEWHAQYDPQGGALLTTMTEPDSSSRTVILRKGLRW